MRGRHFTVTLEMFHAFSDFDGGHVALFGVGVQKITIQNKIQKISKLVRFNNRSPTRPHLKYIAALPTHAQGAHRCGCLLLVRQTAPVLGWRKQAIAMGKHGSSKTVNLLFFLPRLSFTPPPCCVPMSSNTRRCSCIHVICTVPWLSLSTCLCLNINIIFFRSTLARRNPLSLDYKPTLDGQTFFNFYSRATPSAQPCVPQQHV